MAAIVAAAGARSGVAGASLFSGNSQYRSRMANVRRSSSGAVLEDIAEVLPSPSAWLKDIDCKKLSQKGKWEERRLVVTEDRAFVSRRGRILESIPLDEIRQAKAFAPRDPQSTVADVAKWSPVYTARGELTREASFPSLRSESSWKENQSWKNSRIIKMARAVSRTSLEQFEDETAESGKLCFEIVCRESGEYWGRNYVFMCETAHQRTDFLEFINKQTAVATKRRRQKGVLKRWQLRSRKIYESFPFQITVALLIVVAFAIQVWESETFPEEGTASREIIDTTDMLLTLVFTVELGVNIFSHFLWPFIENPWNIFDFIIVVVSLVALVLDAIPGLGALRLMRTFRVLRLFGRLHSFRRIIASLAAALMPVTTAFIVVLLMISVFAIMGVFLFKDKAPEFFGSFSASFFTMFTISTVDGWVDVVNVAAPETLDWGKLYFIAYIIAVVWTLLPVVVAVLLDKFTEVMQKDKERMRRARMPAFKPVTSSALDPILRTLTDFESDDNLSQRIRLLYEALDAESTGSLTYPALSESLRTLRMGKNMRISEEDFEELTQHGRLCDVYGGLSVLGFEQMVRAELRDYLQRGLAGELLKCEEHSISAPILSSLKLLLLPEALGRADFVGDSGRALGVAGRVVDSTSPASLASPRTYPVGQLFGSGRNLLRYSSVPKVPTKSDPVRDSHEAQSPPNDAETLVHVPALEPERDIPGQVPDPSTADATPCTIPVVPAPIEQTPDVVTPTGMGLATASRSAAAEAETGVGGVGELQSAVRQMEALLQEVLGGQKRLESKVDRLDEQVGRLGRGHADVSRAVAEVRAGHGEVVQGLAQVQRQCAAAPAATAREEGAGGACDVCEDEEARTRVGRARVCLLCASLLTDGQL